MWFLIIMLSIAFVIYLVDEDGELGCSLVKAGNAMSVAERAREFKELPPDRIREIKNAMKEFSKAARNNRAKQWICENKHRKDVRDMIKFQCLFNDAVVATALYHLDD